MIIAGAILLALGVGSTIYGFHLNNSVEAQLNALFSSGNVDPGTGWIIAGIIALIIGIVLLVVGITKKPGSIPKTDIRRRTPAKKISRCSNCGGKLDGSPAFCPFCGKSTKQDKTTENRCKYCDSILPPGVAFCPACGKQIETEVSPLELNHDPPELPELNTDGGWNIPTDADL